MQINILKGFNLDKLGKRNNWEQIMEEPNFYKNLDTH